MMGGMVFLSATTVPKRAFYGNLVERRSGVRRKRMGISGPRRFHVYVLVDQKNHHVAFLGMLGMEHDSMLCIRKVRLGVEKYPQADQDQYLYIDTIC